MHGILILDFGSQYTLLIARRLREAGFYSEIIDGIAVQNTSKVQPFGIILSGGPDSVLEKNSRVLPTWIKKTIAEKNIPVLGICYGMQLLVQYFGGTVRASGRPEYGKTQVKILDSQNILAKAFLGFTKNPQVWMSHGDDCIDVEKSFDVIAESKDGSVAGIVHKSAPVVGLQFHPEVVHTSAGLEFLKYFASEICALKTNWSPKNMLEFVLEEIKKSAPEGQVLCACSGGVDSTVAAACIQKALGMDRVTGVLCDTGLLRENEASWVADALMKTGFKDFHVLQSQKKFFDALTGISDPEQKRKIIGRAFIEEFEVFASENSAKKFQYLAQGTLYPDVIESAGHGSGAKVIKSHHNVGGLPDKLALNLLEPFRFLFKDEVRSIGKQLGLETNLIDRHPFPGPGLAVRILGEVTPDKAELLRAADAIFISALREENFYHSVWQAFAVLLPVKTVGVMGDNRTYQWTLALRTVTSEDGMTADVGYLPMEFLVRVSDKIIRKVPGINRVVYDITSKPPATIEWE